MAKEPICTDGRKCFGKRLRSYDGNYHCTVLSKTYKDGKLCPFCKPYCNITNGKLHPFNLNYGMDKEGK